MEKVYMSINMPGYYLVIETPETEFSEELREFFRAYAVVLATQETAKKVLSCKEKWSPTWYGFEISAEELPKEQKSKPAHPDRPVKPLTFSLGDILKDMM